MMEMNNDTQNGKTKKTKTLIIVIVSIFVLGVLSIFVAPIVVEQIDDVMLVKDLIYYTDDTKPKSLGDWIELWKYTRNMLDDKPKYTTTYETDLKKYTEPVWEYLLGKNQNINDNYHAKLTIRNGLFGFVYNIDVDDNKAKVVLDMYVNEENESGNLKPVYEKQCEYYVLLANDIVTSYYKDENGKWLSTTRKPISTGCVAFDLEGMLKAISDLDPYDLPGNNGGYNYPAFENEYGGISMGGRLPTYSDIPADDGFIDTHDVIFIDFSHYPENDHKVNGFLRNPFHVAEFIEEETNWAGKDAFLDYLCDAHHTFTLAGISINAYDKVTVELPEGIDNAEMVDDFQFMVEEIKNIIVDVYE